MGLFTKPSYLKVLQGTLHYTTDLSGQCLTTFDVTAGFDPDLHGIGIYSESFRHQKRFMADPMLLWFIASGSRFLFFKSLYISLIRRSFVKQ